MVRALVGAEALRVGGFLRPGQWDLRVECGGPESEGSCAQVSGAVPQGRVWDRRVPAPRSVGSQGGVWERRIPAPRSVGLGEINQVGFVLGEINQVGGVSGCSGLGYAGLQTVGID